MSASTTIDLGQTTYQLASTVPTLVASGGAALTYVPVTVGAPVDLMLAAGYTNVFVTGVANVSGTSLRVRVQTSDTTTSGSFTDPTSGFQADTYPAFFSSGGSVTIGSGGTNGVFVPWLSGTFPTVPMPNTINQLSGFFAAAAFLRPHRYARTIVESGTWNGEVTTGFICQAKTVGSGFGFSFAPTSGGVSIAS